LRGPVKPSLMDLFSEVGAVTQQAEAISRKREGAKSALVRALLEGETQVCREAVEQSISKIDGIIALECAGFSELENSVELDLEAVSETVRNLAFLEKWRGGLRVCFGRLV
jgi:hypothetical protein